MTTVCTCWLKLSELNYNERIKQYKNSFNYQIRVQPKTTEYHYEEHNLTHVKEV